MDDVHLINSLFFRLWMIMIETEDDHMKLYILSERPSWSLGVCVNSKVTTRHHTRHTPPQGYYSASDMDVAAKKLYFFSHGPSANIAQKSYTISTVCVKSCHNWRIISWILTMNLFCKWEGPWVISSDHQRRPLKAIRVISIRVGRTYKRVHKDRPHENRVPRALVEA